VRRGLLFFMFAFILVLTISTVSASDNDWNDAKFARNLTDYTNHSRPFFIRYPNGTGICDRSITFNPGLYGVDTPNGTWAVYYTNCTEIFLVFNQTDLWAYDDTTTPSTNTSQTVYSQDEHFYPINEGNGTFDDRNIAGVDLVCLESPEYTDGLNWSEGAMKFTSSKGDYCLMNNKTNLDAITVLMWYNQTLGAGGNQFFFDTSTSLFATMRIQTDERLDAYADGSFGAYDITNWGSVGLEGIDQYVGFSWDVNIPSGNYTLFQNGSVMYNIQAILGLKAEMTGFSIGATWIGGSETDAILDNIYINLNEKLYEHEVVALFNNQKGTPTNYLLGEEVAVGAAPPVPTNITIELDNAYNATSVNIFNVTVGNSTYSNTHNTTSGSITGDEITGFYWFNYTATDSFFEYQELVNVTSSATVTGSITPYAEIRLSDAIEGTRLAAFNGTIYNATKSTLYVGQSVLRPDFQGTYNINFTSSDYAQSTTHTVNISGGTRSNYTIFPIEFYGATYSNYIIYSGINITRNITYSVNFTCDSGSATQIILYADAVNLSNAHGITCNNGIQTQTGSYQHYREGQYNISFRLNTSVGDNDVGGNDTFYSDLSAPRLVLSFNITEGFVSPLANLTLQCIDNVTPANLTFNLTFNGVILALNNYTNGSQISNLTLAQDGTNALYGYCADFFNSAEQFINYTVYYQQAVLIDERNNTLFDIFNITGAKVYFDSNQSFYDLWENNATYLNFTSTTEDKLRFEFEYPGGVYITRRVDVSLLDSSTLRICVNKVGVTHYEQLILASQSRPVVLTNVFSDCIVAADYTRFAYQDSNMLKAYTIEANYYLYTFEGDDPTDRQINLASVDGSIADYINIDTLEFSQRSYTTRILTDAFSIETVGVNRSEIYYRNHHEDNTALRIAIERTDTDEVLYNASTFSDLNEVTVVFDYSTLSGITNTLLFKVTVTRTNAAGTNDLIKYFNSQGVSGSQNSAMIFIAGVFLIIFGLTMVAAQDALGFFGAFIILINIGVVSLAASIWYISLLQAINFIILVFIIIMTMGKNPQSIG